MLINLHVKNLALIEDIDVNFKEGLNILTGETGAGKSLVIGSVNIALGAKVNKDIIRNDAEYALVELTFSPDKKAVEYLKSADISVDDENQIIVSRKILNGRSVSKINGETVSVSTLKEAMSYLIDIHGQHEHQSLLYKANHIKILDEFAGNAVLPLKKQIKSLYDDYVKAKKRLLEFAIDDEKRNREIEFCKYEINEIESAALNQNEDEEIEKKYKKMSNSQKMVETASKILSEFGNDNGIEDKVARCMKMAGTLAETDEDFNQIYSQLADLDSICSDVARNTSVYLDEAEYDERVVYETEKRLDLINHLKSKYGNTIEKIYEYLAEKQERLAILENYAEEKLKAENLKKEIEEKILHLSEKLSDIRKENAKTMEEQIIKVLKELNFLSVDFSINFNRFENPTDNGIDDIEFLISTNPGETVKPLAKIASGGELSRIMLAIKTIGAGTDGIDTLIFDEIDTGISGRTAQMLAEKLRIISCEHQIICITHLAQIAAMADKHFMIEKSIKDMKTVTNIYELDYDESIEELSRIIGGAIITEATREHAAQMKEMAVKQKNN